MNKLKQNLQNVKHLFLKDIKSIITPLFTQERMQLEHKSIKDNSYHAAGLLKIILNYSAYAPNIWMTRNHMREDYGLDSLTDHGFFYKSATNLAIDYTRIYKRSCSRSQCQRILDVFVKEGLLRRKKIGKNDKGVHHSTYIYRLNWKRLGELFISLVIPLELLKKVKRVWKKSVTPVLKNIEKLNTTYLEKRKKNRVLEGKTPTTEKSLAVPGQKQGSGIRSLGSQNSRLAMDLETLCPNWRETALSVADKPSDLEVSKATFEKKWERRRWWRVKKSKWGDLWKGWCYNRIMNNWGTKWKRYKDLPTCHRILNEPSTNRQQTKKRDVSFDKQFKHSLSKNEKINQWREVISNMETSPSSCPGIPYSSGGHNLSPTAANIFDLIAEQASVLEEKGNILSRDEWIKIKEKLIHNFCG